MSIKRPKRSWALSTNLFIFVPRRERSSTISIPRWTF